MRSLPVLLLLAIATLPAAGCSSIMAIEQWKCDNFGCCLPGMKPSNSCYPAPMNYSPQGAYDPEVIETIP
jgi:hypothetical protein